MTDWDWAEHSLWMTERYGWTQEQIDADPYVLAIRRRLYAAFYDAERRRRGL